MTLAAGAFLHPQHLLSPLSSAFPPSLPSSLPRNHFSSHYALALALHSPADLLRPHSPAPAPFLVKGVRDFLHPSTDLDTVDASADPTPTLLVPEGGATEEQQVSQALESVTFQPWKKDDSSTDSFGNLLQKQYKPPGRAFRVPRKKVDRWINPFIRKSDEHEAAVDAVQRAQQGRDVSERDGEGTASTAARETERFSTTAVPLVSEAGARYQRLPINLDLQLYWARVLRQKGQQDQSVALLKQCIRDWPDDGRPYVALGTLLRKSGKVQEARKVFEDGCQAVRGENAYIWQAWAVLEDRVGNTGKARKLFDAATAADQSHPAAWQGWAHLELREGNSKKARALLKKGLKYHGPNEYLLQTLALIDVRLGRYEQARILFGKATRANPKSAASWLAWARMEASLECKTTARNLFKSGVEASPKNRYVWQAWALFEAKEGNKERARQLFQRGQQLNPLDPVIYQSYGLFEYDCGHVAIARALFKRGVAVGPQHQPAWIAWAWVEWKQGNLDAARELFQRAIAIDPRSMDAVRSFQAWGILEDREGNVGVARVLFKRALRVDSQNVPTWMSWAAMEERQGNAVRADELRNLCLQQRTEIVDENPWDVNLENMLAPAIDKLRDFLKLEQRFPWSKKERAKPMDERTVGSLEALESTSRLEEEFDVDAFLGEKFSERYGNTARQPRQESKVAVRRQQRLSDNVIT
ncbi:hypothetical protein M758_6G211800 [Ceratodon purpureus]|uniref:Protein high chlorophyll fluorescent 107 n=1 Tax=Ceratodon purpureus TaxID=3225 RepID=A0A8T0HKB2_CERPU|nr:hypothetical protein KC19_6G222700 [Ceratodon purpureus]KAG0614890.1 hypothetical protein M758_6G211800 [Ceratodon purpureus]